MTQQDGMKRAAARAAVAEVADGMVVGLGSGSTAAHALTALGERVAAGLRIVGIPTSERTAQLARRVGIPLGGLADHPVIDLTIDGADEIERGSLSLIKGLGGALLREKIVAAASRRLVVIADDSKLVDRLGRHSPIPVEIVPFALPLTLDRLSRLGADPTPRRDPGGVLTVTDNGNHIADCRFDAPGDDFRALDERLRLTLGVVETGLFIGMAAEAVVGGVSGVIRIAAPGTTSPHPTPACARR
jgi:ribose 5-phosphate isomerase A